MQEESEKASVEPEGSSLDKTKTPVGALASTGPKSEGNYPGSSETTSITISITITIPESQSQSQSMQVVSIPPDLGGFV